MMRSWTLRSMNSKQNTNNPLAKRISHSTQYDPTQLFAIPRLESRKALNIYNNSTFYGVDIWNGYELSWLGQHGVPQIAVAIIKVSADSTNIVESKSVKLYLNSFNQTKFVSEQEVATTIQTDIQSKVQGLVEVKLVPPNQFKNYGICDPDGICIDYQDCIIETYEVTPSYLTTEDPAIKERLYSNLLRTLCPVTMQPDWATVVVEYKGQQIAREGLLKYIVSYREHMGFHESCVENIFVDIMNRCKPTRLAVQAFFTRRGGLDINPFRSTEPDKAQAATDVRLFRQ